MLVSCLCPTAQRRGFMPRAISCFLEQDYEPRELIILDDGEDAVRDLIPADPRIRYFYELPPRNHGQKMNRCMELSRGALAIVWDSDDWYSPHRLRRQIQPLLDNPEIDVTGTSRLYYYIHGSNRGYRYQNWTIQPWLAAIAFRRSAWEAHRFAEWAAGADGEFQRSIPRSRWHDVNDLSLLVASLHESNASPKLLPNMSFLEVPWAEIEGVTAGGL